MTTADPARDLRSRMSEVVLLVGVAGLVLVLVAMLTDWRSDPRPGTRVRVATCEECGAPVHNPAIFCPGCLDEDDE